MAYREPIIGVGDLVRKHVERLHQKDKQNSHDPIRRDILTLELIWDTAPSAVRDLIAQRPTEPDLNAWAEFSAQANRVLTNALLKHWSAEAYRAYRRAIDTTPRII